MQLDRDDPGTGGDQRTGQRAVPGADVEHQFARPDRGVGHDPGGPFVSERMPAPRPPRAAHGGPP